MAEDRNPLREDGLWHCPQCGALVQHRREKCGGCQITALSTQQRMEQQMVMEQAAMMQRVEQARAQMGCLLDAPLPQQLGMNLPAMMQRGAEAMGQELGLGLSLAGVRPVRRRRGWFGLARFGRWLADRLGGV